MPLSQNELGRGEYGETMNAATIAYYAPPKVVCGADREFEPKPRGRISLRPLNILLVDDDPSLREAVAEYLRREGHTVETAVDGVHGLEVFCNGTWDMVLVDRAMPRMNGFELALAIKQRNSHIPIVLVSGIPSAFAASEEFSSCVDVAVPKPFGVEHLRDGMIRALQMHGAL